MNKDNLILCIIYTSPCHFVNDVPPRRIPRNRIWPVPLAFTLYYTVYCRRRHDPFVLNESLVFSAKDIHGYTCKYETAHGYES